MTRTQGPGLRSTWPPIDPRRTPFGGAAALGMASRKNKFLTPLQQEAARIEEEKKRRQDAIKAAQEYALRGGLERKTAARSTATAAAVEPEEVVAPDFDVVRQALKDERHRESRKNDGENPRYIAVTDKRSESEQ